jgi:epoxide hydrolase
MTRRQPAQARPAIINGNSHRQKGTPMSLAIDPAATVRADVHTLVTAPQLSSSIMVSGYVYNTTTGTLDTVVAPTPQAKADVRAELDSSGEPGDDRTGPRTIGRRPPIPCRDLGFRDRGPQAAAGQDSLARSGTVPDWSQGVRVENAKSLVTYWEREYDWRRFESELNRFPQFLTTIDGLDIHFIHVKSKNPDAMPLILTHGWPGSIVEFLRLIGPLTDPVAFGGHVEDSFDVVVPSLPGFGFSEKPTEAGWTVSRIATAWVELMKRLGYENWAAQGGDWGSVVTTVLGAMRPEGLLGIHLNTPYAFPAQIPDTLSPEERYAVDGLALYTGDLGGSNHLQGTKPETVGFALVDSPAGQAAWIYEKFQSKTDNHGLAEDALSTDDMLDAISLYWFTNSAASSGRIYWQNRSASMAGPKLTLPVAVTVFP